MHHVFIVNPTAGKGEPLLMAERIRARFSDFPQTYDIRMTKEPGHAEILAKEAVAEDRNIRIYSVGGDGTLNEVVNGIAGSNVELGIIPCGSGNDAVRSLYPVTDPVKLIEVLPYSSSVPIDLGRLNERFFINIASIGFDAEVAYKSRSFKRIPFVSGPMSYVLGVLVTLINLKKYKLNISLNGSPTFEKEILLSIFANGAYYGGGMKAAPRAQMDDGLFDFYVVDTLPRRRLLRFFPLFKKGEFESLEEVTRSQGTKARISSERPFPVNLDGEVGYQTNVTFDLIPKALRVITP